LTGVSILLSRLKGSGAVISMLGRSLFALAAFCGLAAAGEAADMASSLPTFALAPPPLASEPSFTWSGLYVGTGVFAVSGNGSKPHVGGDAEIGYNYEFANRIVVGVNEISGFSPALFGHGPVKGFDFSTTQVLVGYDMGRWMPYVTSGLALVKPINGPQANYVSASQSANDLFAAPGRLHALPTIGAGVDYAITPNLRVGVGVSTGNSFGAPFH
jgi:opacity protein-like surface antigen